MGERDGDLRYLVAAAIEGDDVAVREFVRLTQPAVWGLCGVLGSPGEEEDLVQETYLRALRSLSGYRGESSVTGWLLSIARRVCADHVRTRQRQRRVVQSLNAAPSETFAVDPDNPTWEIVCSIDPARREAFVLTQLAGLSYEDAAALLDCPVGTIRSRVSRARADLVEAVRSAQAS